MKCSLCSGKSVFDDLCKQHFIDNFEEKVIATIKRFDLVRKGQKIAVACSGGKDSVSILYVMNKYFGNVTAVAIDEGIAGYRDVTLEDLRRICSKYKIELKTYSYKDLFGHRLDEMTNKTSKNPCSICGVFRRSALNKAASGFDVIVTGHNMDDEAQAVMMNFLKGNLELSARLGPKTGMTEDSGFTQRVKPLYFCSEKETAAYAFLMGFDVKFIECPNAGTSFRASVRDSLNEYEAQNPGTKQSIIERFLEMSSSLKSRYSSITKPDPCNNCGQPCKNGICQACNFITLLEVAQ